LTGTRAAKAAEPVASLTWAQVLAWRVGRQGLARRVPASKLLGVTARICGLHAQVFSSAELTLWARTNKLQPDAVGRALWEDRTLVKTWAMRGTLHLLPAADLPLYVAAQQTQKPRHHTGAWQRYYGVAKDEAEAMLAAIPEALSGEPLTREELADEVSRLTGHGHLAEKLRRGFGELLKPSAFRGDLCFAPNDGPRVRFTRPDRWLPAWPTAPPFEPDAAMAQILRRYLAVYGPASRQDFIRWFGLTSPTPATTAIDLLGDELVPVEIDGQRAWHLASELKAIQSAKPAAVVNLLPAFDHYTVAAPRDTEAVLPKAFKARVYRPQGWLSPVMLVDGRMAGTWSHEQAGKRLRVEVAPFAPLEQAVRAGVEAEVERLAGYLGRDLGLEWAKPV
jgi:hypothetical protein